MLVGRMGTPPQDSPRAAWGRPQLVTFPGTSQDPDEAPPGLWAGEPGTVGRKADDGLGTESGPRCEPRAKAGPSRGLNGMAAGLM